MCTLAKYSLVPLGTELLEISFMLHTAIREELSKMSFEELQKLKERLGSKVYNEAMFGAHEVKRTNFKRENKNRPREMSSKHPARTENLTVHSRKAAPRDPRFDSLCGSFNEKGFRHAYSFVSDLRAQEKEQLKQELKTHTDPSRKDKIKYLLQRMVIYLLNQSTEKRVLDLVEQYEELKESGKLQKHIRKHRKRNVQKDRKRLNAVNVL
ncbi:hypothetical protein Cfor_07100 [Coptotermes formosanus]|uniref:rRNA biogenesis protein RRP36 n=1 Tax=Coptotermes formosanus TaxID=36987 RepID=A0A6L2Q0Z7_COPFO|nr:hypothetical protein Cfor_07100 [Coptotermes formosanus]